MKVVYVVESLQPGGGVKVIVEQAAGLAARGHDVVIVTKDPAPGWIEVPVPVVAVPRFDGATLPEADVHVATWFETVVPTVRAGRAKRIFHFCQGFEAPHPHLKHLSREIEEAYAQPVPKLLVSAHLLPLLQPRFPGPYHLLAQAIPAADFAPPDPDRSEPRRPPVIGVVGPFQSVYKGIDVALRAARRLREKGRRFRLHRASQLPQSQEELSLYSCDAYRCSIPSREMPGFYHGLDLLLHPSFEAEGFPLPPLEAMAAGVPVVLTDIPSFEPIPRDAASRVPPGDDAAMAKEAARLLDDPALWGMRRRRGMEVAATFTLGPVLDRLERILGDQKTS